jgi:PAS domain S-box-containing protein
VIKKNSEYKILIVEDEAVIALNLQQTLIKMGYNVIGISYSGKDAVDKARRLVPDLILMDIRLPGKMDGIRVADIVKSELDIPVIFLTAFSEDKIIERAKKVEPFGYILKPIQEREIKAAVEVALYKKEMEKILKESEEKFRTLAEGSRVGFWQTTLDGHTIYINPAMCRILEIEAPEELHGKTYDTFYDDKNRQIIKDELVKREKGISSTYEVELTGKKGTKRNVMISGAPLFLAEDKIHSAIATFIDITDKTKAEKALMNAHDELEKRVKERTKELKIKTQNLEETNIAMKVLLKKREEDRKDIEYNILTNVKKLIDPYFDKIRKTKLDSRQKAFLNIMESNLQEITSQFARKISLRELNLTPTEIQIANMIRQGNSSKEIAEIMNVSIRTVDAHRRNIRKKIGLNQKRANLRSYLLSLH